MKKIPILLTALFLLAGAGLFFTACGGGGDPSSPSGGNDTGNNGSVGGTTLAPGSGGSLLVEKGHAWLHNPYNHAYLFKADGTYLFLRHSPPIWEKMVSGVYTTSGGILTLTYVEGFPNYYAYSVTGDTLTLVDEYGEVDTFTNRYEYAIDVLYYDGGW